MSVSSDLIYVELNDGTNVEPNDGTNDDTIVEANVEEPNNVAEGMVQKVKQKSHLI